MFIYEGKIITIITKFAQKKNSYIQKLRIIREKHFYIIERKNINYLFDILKNIYFGKIRFL